MSKGYTDYFPALSSSSAYPADRGISFSAQGSSLASPRITTQEKKALLQQILNNKIHGISFSPYLDRQAPGTDIPAEQIAQRLRIIQPHTHWIRSFSTTEGHQATPGTAHQQGLKTMVGVSLGEKKAENEAEFINGIELARSGHADILAVGNEVLLRGDMPANELIGYIQRAKEAAPNATVGYVDAYFLFEENPQLVEVCDVILINCYPFWEGTPIEYALHHMKHMYQRITSIAGDKRVIISETGWPSQGEAFGTAVPGQENALDYFINTYQWAAEEGIDVFYFSAFDELWKTGDEGDVGAYWGLWDKEGNLKYV